MTDPADEDALALDAELESDGAQHRRFRLNRDVNKRLDRYLCDRLPGLSRSRLQKLINEGAVLVNDRAPRSSTIIRAGDVIDVMVPPPSIKQIPPEDIPVQVLWEDEHLIAINKQPNLIVHPARSNLSGTLVNALAWYFKDVAANGLEALSSVGVDEFRPGVIHRLDKDTTGVIVVAKTDEAHWRMGRLFEKRQVQKYYLAIVHGQVTPPGDVIDQPIGKHANVTEAYAVRHDQTGRDSVTIYRVRELYEGYSLVELELKTGRTHQIRVHLTWLGHPIISDIIYGGEPFGTPELATPVLAAGGQPFLTFARQKTEGVRLWQKMEQREDLLIERPALHAAVLRFKHPMTDARVDLTAPLWPDMQQTIRKLQAQSGGPSYLKAEGAEVAMGSVMGPTGEPN